MTIRLVQRSTRFVDFEGRIKVIFLSSMKAQKLAYVYRVADVWIEIFSGIALFLCYKMALAIKC